MSDSLKMGLFRDMSAGKAKFGQTGTISDKKSI